MHCGRDIECETETRSHNTRTLLFFLIYFTGNWLTGRQADQQKHWFSNCSIDLSTDPSLGHLNRIPFSSKWIHREKPLRLFLFFFSRSSRLGQVSLVRSVIVFRINYEHAVRSLKPIILIVICIHLPLSCLILNVGELAFKRRNAESPFTIPHPTEGKGTKETMLARATLSSTERTDTKKNIFVEFVDDERIWRQRAQWEWKIRRAAVAAASSSGESAKVKE